MVVREIDMQVIKWVPCTPIFLPSNPGRIELNKGSKINVRYIKIIYDMELDLSLPMKYNIYSFVLVYIYIL